MRQPISLRRRVVFRACAKSVSIAVSVISNSIRLASTPDARTTSSILSTDFGDRRSRADRLNEMRISSGHRRAASSAFLSSVGVRLVMRPERSAARINTSGGTRPSFSLCQRARASKPTTRFWLTSYCGWKARVSSFSPSMPRRACSTAFVDRISSSWPRSNSTAIPRLRSLAS